MSLLGLDIGTTGCKAIVFDVEGNILGSAYREYPLVHPRPGWTELDATLVWSRVEESIRQAVGNAGPHDPVKALALSTQGEAVCPVDQEGNALANSIVTFDNRAVDQATRLAASLGSEAIFRMSGQPLHPMGTINKIAWWKENRPDIYDNAWKFLCYEDLAFARLGLPPTMDFSMAARTMAFDIQNQRWSPEILAVFGIDERKLPRIAPSGTVVGIIPDNVCERLGLPSGVLAITGGHDQPCGALGAGAVTQGRAMYAIGTVECVTPALESFLPDLGSQGFPCYPHVIPNMFVTLGFNFGGGSILRWYRDVFGQLESSRAQAAGQDVYDVILGPVDTTPGDLMLLPHFAGTGTPWLDPMSKGAILGFTLDTSKESLVKAILEGTTYEIALNTEAMTGAGLKLNELRAIGGGAKSAKWLQIKADILGIPLVTLSVSEAACLGAAILAGYGAELFPDIAQAADALAAPIRTFEPNSEHHRRHQERLAIYRQLYPTLKHILHTV